VPWLIGVSALPQEMKSILGGQKLKRKIFSVLFALVLVASLSLVTAVPVSADGDVVLVDFGPTPRTPSLEGTISHDGSNLNFTVTVYDQDVADDDYLAFWIDPDYLNKDLSGMSNQFDSPWNEHNKLLMLNFYKGNTDPEWGDGTGGNCPWMQKSTSLPAGVSLTYTDTDDGMNWEGTIPFSVLGMSAGDTFGYMFAARIKTDVKYVDGYPEMVYGFTPGWDLRDYNTWAPPPTKADILKDSGVPGKGLDKAPGLQKPFNPNSQAGNNAGKK